MVGMYNAFSWEMNTIDVKLFAGNHLHQVVRILLVDVKYINGFDDTTKPSLCADGFGYVYSVSNTCKNRAANGSRSRYISIWKMDPSGRSRSTRYTFEIQIQWIHLQPYLWYIFIEWQQHPLGLLQVRADRHNPTIKVISMRHWTNPATHINLNGCISLTSTYDSLQKLDFLFAIWLASWP